MRVGGARRAQGLGPQAQAAVKKAFDLRESDPAGSAAEFERLAGIASERDMPGMAAHFSMQAARSSGAAGNDDAALAHGRTAVNFASQAKNTGKAARKFGTLVTELRTGGRTGVADTLEAEAKARLGLSALPAGSPGGGINRQAKRNMPKFCSTCGAAVNYEPEYGEDGVPDCKYCGTGLLG